MSFPQTRGAEVGIAVYQRLFETAPSPMALTGVDEAPLTILAANPAFLRLVGHSRAGLEGRRLDAAFRATAAEQIRRAAAMAIDRDECVRLRIAHAQGYDVVRLELELQPLSLETGRYLLLSVASSVPASGLGELGESGVLAELGALSRGLVYIHDVVRRVVRHGHHPLADRLGLLGGELDIEDVRALVHPDDRERFIAYGEAQVGAPDERISSGTFRMRAAQGDWLWVGLRTRMFTRDAEGAAQRIIGVATDLTDEYEHAAALNQAITALAKAELGERRRIGRELHDSTAQLLLAARLGLGALERQGGLEEGGLRLLEDVRQAVVGAQTEIRNFTYLLHPPGLQEQGLERCVRAFAAGFARRTGLPVSVKTSRAFGRLTYAAEAALYRVVQEALMNVYRHAGASRAYVRLRRAGEGVVLEVEDDGAGLPKGGADRALQGVGISGMRARLLQLHGSLELLPAPKKGLMLRATLPDRPARPPTGLRP